jgi:hypothetical protein
MANQQLEANQAQIHASMTSFDSAVQQYLGNRDLSGDLSELIQATLTSRQESLARLQTLENDLAAARPYFQVLESRERLNELQIESRRLTATVDAMRSRLRSYSDAESFLEQIVEASKSAERELLEELVTSFHQPISEAYRWLSPHPLFTDLTFRFGKFDDAGELYFSVARGDAELNPAATFSAAQANALALAVFLALNTAQGWSPLDVALIDDPVQHMDTVNVLSLVDLLRSVAEGRQLLFSTSSVQLQDLLADKLRPTKPGRQLLSYHFVSLTEDGPALQESRLTYQVTPRLLSERFGQPA